MATLNSTYNRIWLVLLLNASLLVSACADEYTDIGQFRLVQATDGLFGLKCQPRTDFYFIKSKTNKKPELIYLGTCSTPKFVTDDLGMPSDPSCFALAKDASSLVYFHRPNWCGAGEQAKAKQGGAYLYHVTNGEQLLYSDKQVGQIWSKRAIEPNAIRVSWSSNSKSKSGASCSQRLLIFANGDEQPEGEPTTIHGCKNN